MLDQIDVTTNDISGFRIVAVAVVLMELVAGQLSPLVGVAAITMGMTALTIFQTAGRFCAHGVAGVRVGVRALAARQCAVGHSDRTVAGVGMLMAAQVGDRSLQTADQLVGRGAAFRRMDVTGVLNQTAGRFCIPHHTVAVGGMNMTGRFLGAAHQGCNLLVAVIIVLMLGVVHQGTDQSPLLVITLSRVAVPIGGGDAAANAAIGGAAGIRVGVRPETALQQLHNRLAGLPLLFPAGQLQCIAIRRVGMLCMSAVGFGLQRLAGKHQDIGRHDRHNQRHCRECAQQPDAVAAADQIFLRPHEQFFTHCASPPLRNDRHKRRMR